MKLVMLILSAFFLCSVNAEKKGIDTTALKAAPPKGFEKVDLVIKLGSRHGDIRFDKEVLTVKPGQKVKIEFRNSDEMPHNVVILKPGTSTKMIGELALKLGAEGLKVGYIPKSDKIIASMKMVEPGKSGVLYFQAPKAKVVLPFVCTIPGHYLKMIGVINVGVKAKVVKKKDNFEIVIKDKPYIYRSGININAIGKRPYSIAVGLPGGMNYVFDAESCTVTAAWTGKYLSAKGDWNGRGGNGANIIGDIFYRNKNHQCLYLPKKGGVAKYSGYRVYKGVPTFIYYVGVHKVTLTVSAKDGKLMKKYTITGAQSANYIAAPKAKVTSSGKSLVNGELRKTAVQGLVVVKVEVAP